MNKSVLVVTENSELRLLCQGLGNGYQLVFAHSGEEALRYLDQSPATNIILADYKLADMDGLTFFIRAAELSPAVPILAADADQIIARIEMVNHRAIYRILPLPCTSEILVSVFEDALEQFRLVEQELRLREEIKRLTYTDELTGCYTRRYVDDRLPRELGRSVRYDHFLSVALIDIDQLKQINLDYGRDFGDQVLEIFSEAAIKVIRNDVDWIARWGDDEFLMVLPEVPVQGAKVVAERLRQLVADLDLSRVTGNEVDLTLSASIGIAGYSPEQPQQNNTHEQLLESAFACLRQVQEQGGNRITCCT